MSTDLNSRWHRFEKSADAYLAVTGLLLLLILVPIATSPQHDFEGIITVLIAGGAATLSLLASEARPWAIRLSFLAWIAAFVSILVPGRQEAIIVVASLVLGVLLVAAPFVILRRIARHHAVTATTMWGAIAAYLSLGIAFSFVYIGIHQADPQAFTNVIDGGLSEFNYFSFVTMTTLGYGDMTPVSDLARALAVLQTVIGQIFLVVVVARVVSLLGTGRRLRSPDNE